METYVRLSFYLSLAATVATLALVTQWTVLRWRQRARGVTSRFVVPLDDPPSAWSYASRAPYVVMLLFLALTTGLMARWIPELAPRVPLHWDAGGHPNRWGSPRELWLGVAMQLLFLALPMLVLWTTSRERWALPVSGAERYAELQLERRRVTVRFVEWLAVILSVTVGGSFAGLSYGLRDGHQAAVGPAILLGVVLAPVGMLMLLFALLQRAAKIQDELREIAGTDVLGTRADGWRWGGLIYYSPDDPALWIPKRFGIGQTVNFARRGAWLFLAAVLVLPLALTLGARFAAR